MSVDLTFGTYVQRRKLPSKSGMRDPEHGLLLRKIPKRAAQKNLIIPVGEMDDCKYHLIPTNHRHLYIGSKNLLHSLLKRKDG